MVQSNAQRNAEFVDEIAVLHIYVRMYVFRYIFPFKYLLFYTQSIQISRHVALQSVLRQPTVVRI